MTPVIKISTDRNLLDFNLIYDFISNTFAVFIALLTVSFQAIKTAIANPVKSLRTE